MRGARMLQFLAPLLVAPLLLRAAGDPSGPAQCGGAKVQYRPFDTAYAKRMAVEVLRSPVAAADSGNKQYSPQRTMWQVTILPNYAVDGPWTTTVYIGSVDDSEALKLSFLKHSNGGVDIKWLNEKLLFGIVWWGRIYSTDFVFNVEKREFVYREMAHYGELIQPCSN